jgi:RNA polymerase sigma-70 factor, ECF subfamily
VSPTAHDHPVWERATAAVDDAAADGAQAAAALIARLPRAQAEVVLLRVVGGLSGEEVARITGRSEGAVRVIQHRALRRLRREFGAGPEAV